MPNAITPETRIAELEITLECLLARKNHRVISKGDWLFLSAHTPRDARPDAYVPGKCGVGKVGDTISEKEAYQAARDTGIAILSTLRDNLGSLNRVKRLISANVVVNCKADFTALTPVMEGFSYLMDTVFGPQDGVGALSVIGANSLPDDMPVAVTNCIFEISNT
jgi:hypothetical protein